METYPYFFTSTTARETSDNSSSSSSSEVPVKPIAIPYDYKRVGVLRYSKSDVVDSPDDYQLFLDGYSEFSGKPVCCCVVLVSNLSEIDPVRISVRLVDTGEEVDNLEIPVGAKNIPLPFDNIGVFKLYGKGNFSYLVDAIIFEEVSDKAMPELSDTTTDTTDTTTKV